MLLALLILQVIMLPLLSQTHQQILSQLKQTPYYLPVNPQQQVLTCLAGHCHDSVSVFKLIPLTQSGQRQYSIAKLKICSNQDCYTIEQVISRDSAILKEDVNFHATRINTEA